MNLSPVRDAFFVWLCIAGWVSSAEPPITAVAFTSDGQSIVGVSQSGLHEFSWPDLTHRRTIKTAAPNLHCLAFSPDGRSLAIGGGNPSEDGFAEVFFWPSGKRVAQRGDHDDTVRAVVWTSNTQLVTASIDRKIKQWVIPVSPGPRPSKNDVETLVGELGKGETPGHSRGVESLCLLNDGNTLISAGRDNSLRVWQLDTLSVVRTLNQHTQPVNSLALCPNVSGIPFLASASADRAIRFWQPTIGRMVRYIRLDAEPLNIVWLNEKHIAATCTDGTLRVVDSEEVKVVQTHHVLHGWPYALARHPTDGTLAIAGSDGKLKRMVIALSQPVK